MSIATLYSEYIMGRVMWKCRADLFIVRGKRNILKENKGNYYQGIIHYHDICVVTDSSSLYNFFKFDLALNFKFAIISQAMGII